MLTTTTIITGCGLNEQTNLYGEDDIAHSEAELQANKRKERGNSDFEGKMIRNHRRAFSAINSPTTNNEENLVSDLSSHLTVPSPRSNSLAHTTHYTESSFTPSDDIPSPNSLTTSASCPFSSNSFVPIYTFTSAAASSSPSSEYFDHPASSTFNNAGVKKGLRCERANHPSPLASSPSKQRNGQFTIPPKVLCFY